MSIERSGLEQLQVDPETKVLLAQFINLLTTMGVEVSTVDRSVASDDRFFVCRPTGNTAIMKLFVFDRDGDDGFVIDYEVDQIVQQTFDGYYNLDTPMEKIEEWLREWLTSSDMIV